MHVFIEHKLKEEISFDETGYGAFLQSQCFTNAEVDALSVYIQNEPTPAFLGAYKTINDRTYGCFYHPGQKIFVWKRRCNTKTMSEILLHETRHYWQYQKNRQIFDYSKPYQEQPHEVDARKFAAQHIWKHQFIRSVKKPFFTIARTMIASHR